LSNTAKKKKRHKGRSLGGGKNTQPYKKDTKLPPPLTRSPPPKKEKGKIKT